MTLASMDVDPVSGKLYVAVSSSDRLFVLSESAVVDQWVVGRHPSGVRFIPGKGLVAILSLVEDRLTLLDQTGQVVATYETGSDPQGIMLGQRSQELYAGDTVIDLSQQLTRTLSVPMAYQVACPPVQTVLDTRRNILYAVASNGVPGSNAGYVATRFVEGEFDLTAPAPGRLSVLDLIYDEEMDHFYATNWRIDSFGLQVSDAEDCQETLYLRLDRYPGAMILNPATHHLWLALHPAHWWCERPRDTVIRAFDTRNFGRAAEFKVAGLAQSMAIDPSTDRIYVDVGEENSIYVLQDVPMVPPPAPTNTPTPTCQDADDSES